MAKRTINRKKRSQEAKLNITSMMDMFTIILVFLLKSFSAQGQLVTPAKGLKIPSSSVEKNAVSALDLEVSTDNKNRRGRTVEKGKITVEGKFVLYTNKIKEYKGFLIPELEDVLTKYSEEAEKASKMFGEEFEGNINIQGDTSIPYEVLTKIMYTCGQSGFPNMNLVVYRQE